MRTLSSWFCLAVGFALVASLSMAEEKKGDRKPASESKKEGGLDDKEFVTKAASGGMLEVHSSRYALDQGKSEAVKKFARQMIDDHSKANQELVGLAARKNIPVPQGLVPKHADVLKSLGKLTGEEFDKAYAKAQVESHQEAVSLFESAAKNVKDAELKAWAEKTLPTLKHHLTMAQELRSDTKTGKGDAPKKGDTPKKDDTPRKKDTPKKDDKKRDRD